ncbi:MAG: hypothetical protein EGR77_11305 [Pseudobutyrivibrio sp.]|nr:hypothetical protein [Pseudobutyrivibrio sp.]
MASKKHNYTLADILGTPRTKQDALSFIRQNTTTDTLEAFNLMDKMYQKKLLHFIQGNSGLAITYDRVFRPVMMPNDSTERLEAFLSAILGEAIYIKNILPREGSQISEKGSFIIADIIASLENGSIINVEIQKIGYMFPGERCSCYTADMIMRQYNYLKHQNPNFSYQDMKPVYLIVLMENSPEIFHSTRQYIHRMQTSFDTGISLNLLDNITLISLDTFENVVQNISSRQDAWLKFLTTDNPNEIIELVNRFPEFLSCYRDLIAYRNNPEELICMFSDALNEMDRNTERYMVEELNKHVIELKGVVSDLGATIQTQENTIQTQENTIQTQENRIQTQEATILQLQQKLAQYEKNNTCP